MQKMSLGEYGPASVWFTSIGSPTGITVALAAVEDEETGQTYDLDPWDAANALPFGFDLMGTTDEGGDWRWDGEGNPRDWGRNTVTAIVATRSSSA